MLTHGSLRANLDQARSDEHLSPGDVVYGVIPLYHIYGLNVVLGQTCCRSDAPARAALRPGDGDRVDPRAASR